MITTETIKESRLREFKPLELLEAAIFRCLDGYVDKFHRKSIAISGGKVKVFIYAPESQVIKDNISKCFVLNSLNLEKDIIFKTED